jgi:hypothetical protein
MANAKYHVLARSHEQHNATQAWERDQQHDNPHHSLLHADCAKDKHRNIFILFIPRYVDNQFTTLDQQNAQCSS